MTIEQLKKYRDICSEIDEIQQELNGKHYAADTVSVCTPPSYTAHSKRIEGYLPDGNTISLLARLSDLRAQKRACEEYIDSIKDWQTKEMFKAKFYEGKTYLQVAMKIGKGRLSEDCVEKRIKRYLKKH